MRIAGIIDLDGSTIKLDQGGSHTQITSNTPAGDITITLPKTASLIVGAEHGGDATKAVKFTSDGATTAKTLILDTNHTDDRTWTLQDATDTFVGLATTDTLTNKSIDSDNNTLTNIANADIKSAAAIAVDKLAALTASRATVTDGSGFVSAATTTATEIGYVNGVTSAIQTQIDAKAGTTVATATTAGLVTSYDGTVQSSVKDIGDAAYTVLDADGFSLIKTDATALTADRTVTLPTASANTGRKLTFKKGDSGAFDLIVDGEGAETIDGATTKTLTNQYEATTIICDGDEWHTVSETKRLANARLHQEAASLNPGSNNTVVYDTTDYNNGDMTISSGAVTIGTTGRYLVTAGLIHTSGAGGYIAIYIDGTIAYHGSTIASTDVPVAISHAREYDAGDIITIRTNVNATLNVTTAQAKQINHFSITQLD